MVKWLLMGTLDQLRSKTDGKGSSLEDVFLKLTNEEVRGCR